MAQLVHRDRHDHRIQQKEKKPRKSIISLSGSVDNRPNQSYHKFKMYFSSILTRLPDITKLRDVTRYESRFGRVQLHAQQLQPDGARQFTRNTLSLRVHVAIDSMDGSIVFGGTRTTATRERDRIAGRREICSS